MNLIEYSLIFIVIFLIIYRVFIYKTKIENMVQILIRSCARWGTASLQDKSPLIAVLHANYAAGYLWAIRDIFTDEEIKKATGINRVEFEKKIIDVQDKATKYMMEVCPKYGSNLESELARIGGE
jgi:hypothetical protein